MTISHRLRQGLMTLALILVLAVTTACSSVASPPQANAPGSIDHSVQYGQLARGDSTAGQAFGDWVVQASKGLIKDAFVRDNNKLGVVISSQVRPNEVKALSKSLTQGFHKNFPNQDLTVLMYGPNKELLMTARYDSQSQQIEYQAAS